MSASFLRLAAALCLLCATAVAQVTFGINEYATRALDEVRRGDFNRDGNPDAIAWSTKSAGFTVFLNDGTGIFTQRATATGKIVSHLAVADFNEDGNNDVVACVSTTSAAEKSRTLRLYMGDGDGTFTASAVALLAPNGCAGLAAYDFNLDANLDIAVAYFRGTGTGSVNGILVFPGNGAGGFSSVVATDPIGPAGRRITDVAVADFNNDRYPDLVLPLCCSATGAGIGMARGTGGGHFTYVTVATAMDTHAVELADNNLDSLPDFISRHSGAIGFWQSQSNFTFVRQTPERIATTGENALYDGGSIDINTDGIKDVVISAFADVTNDGVPEPYLLTFLKDGNGSYVLRQVHPLAHRVRDMVLADFDRDGLVDIFGVDGSAFYTVALNRASSATKCQRPFGSEREVNACIPSAMMSPVRVHGTTRTFLDVQAIKVYVDGLSRFTTTDDTFVKYIPMTTGDHRVTVKAWDRMGPFSEVNFVFAQATEQCTPSEVNRTVRICSPANQSTVGNPVRVWAAITDTNTVNAVKVYVDGFDRLTSGTTKLIDWQTELTPGTHRITVKAWDFLGEFSSTVFVTVQ